MKTMKITYCVLAAFGLAMSSMAGITTYTNYGDFAAANVDFLQVQEHTTTTGDSVPKYDAPNVTTASDRMDFDPVGFSAISANGVSDTTDGNLVFDVLARDGFGIEEIGFAEKGLFTLGGTPVSVATYVQVTALFTVEVTEVNGAPVANPIEDTVLMEFTPDLDGKFELGVNTPGIWTGSVSIDLNALVFADDNYDENARATRLSIDLNNLLEAYSVDGTSSSISKKDFDSFGMSVEIVPEPASMALIGLISGVMVFIRRRFII